MHNRARARLGAWEPIRPRASRPEPSHRPAPDLDQALDGRPELREALRVWRSRKSRELGVPPYTLFWDRTLDELCDRRPATMQELATIWGIGEQKRRSFGAELLAMIAACPG
jgi:ATP-dependent DNA helicase RecQ